MGTQKRNFTTLDVLSGKAYFLCQCGQSANMPHCDGSHRGSSVEPERYVATRDTTIVLCGCSERKITVCECAQKE